MRCAVLAVLLGCGRVGFDPIGDSDSGTGGSGSGAVCGGTDKSCFSNSVTLSRRQAGAAAATSSNFTNNLRSFCGGADGADAGILFIALDAGTYEFTVNAAFDTVLYALSGDLRREVLTAARTRRASGEQITLDLSIGQRIVIVVDSGSGCGDFSVSYRSI